MGFIGKLIGGIFAFLGGILKIFGIGKSGYYMEAESLPAGAPPSAAPSKVEATKTESAKASAKAAETKVEKAPAPADLAPASLETVKAAIPAASTNGAANGKKSRKAATTEAAKPSAPVKTAESAAKADQTFAPNYLIQTSGSRRRPGPSLDPFRNIAKQVKS